MNVQRATKPAVSFAKKQLVPFPTPSCALLARPARVTARALFPAIYNVQSSQFLQPHRFGKGSVSNTIFDLRHMEQQLVLPHDASHTETSSFPYLFMNFGGSGSEYKDTAVLFPDGVLVTWYMSKERESDLASDLLAFYSRSVGLVGPRKEQIAVDQFSSMDTAESMSVSLSQVSENLSHVTDVGSLTLTAKDIDRSNDMLAVSMAMATAVRMNLVESHLQEHIESGHSRITGLLQTLSGWKLSKISESIFEAEQLVHNWRYFLTQKGIDDIPDCLWDHERLDRLYGELMSHFVLHKRFSDLNNDLTYYSDYLSTVGEHVRHKYSSRLEIIIILIIGIEAGIATRHLVLDLVGRD